MARTLDNGLLLEVLPGIEHQLMQWPKYKLVAALLECNIAGRKLEIYPADLDENEVLVMTRDIADCYRKLPKKVVIDDVLREVVNTKKSNNEGWHLYIDPHGYFQVPIVTKKEQQ